MSSQGSPRVGHAEKLAEIKAISGWCIERQRWQMKLTQEDVASEAGLTSRWVREIEGGSPKTTLDHHLKCAAALDLSIGYLMIPSLYIEHGGQFPRELLLGGIAAIERRCLDAIAEHVLGGLCATLSVKPTT